MRGSVLLLAFMLQMATPPALAELRYFYCYVPDTTSGAVYVSDVHPVGPIAERAAYGAQFLAYLKSKGIAPSAQVGYCTMRATQAEMQQGQQDLAGSCENCGGASRLSSVQWDRSKAEESSKRSRTPNNSSKDMQQRYTESVQDALRSNDPGVCYTTPDGGVRCTKGQSTTPQARTSAVSAPKKSDADSSPAAARADVCVTDASITTARRQECINRKPVVPESAKRAATTTTGGTKKRPQAPAPLPRAEEPGESSPAPSPNHRKTQACTTLPRELDTVIVIVEPEIFVTMTPGAFLYMRDHLGNEHKLGYGNHRVRPGTYKLGIYGVTDPLNPLKQTLQACVAYYTDF